MNKAECWGGRGAEPITHKLKKEEKRSKSIQLPPSLCGELMECFSFPLLRKRRRKGRGANAATTNISITIGVNEMIGFALWAPLCLISSCRIDFIQLISLISFHQLAFFLNLHFALSLIAPFNSATLSLRVLSLLRSIAAGAAPNPQKERRRRVAFIHSAWSWPPAIRNSFHLFSFQSNK